MEEKDYTINKRNKKYKYPKKKNLKQKRIKGKYIKKENGKNI